MYPKINKKKEEEGEGERDKRREETTKGFAVASTVACPFCFVVRRLKVSTHTHTYTHATRRRRSHPFCTSTKRRTWERGI